MAKTSIKRILCFGDSNTWGYIPNSNHNRFSNEIRFPKVLQTLLGGNYEIIEEGLNSRTLVNEDLRPGKEGRNGSAYIIPCIDSHDPIDLVVIMLGTNELKHSNNNTAETIGKLFSKYFVEVIINRKSQFNGSCPELLIISLPLINENTAYASERYIGGTRKSKELKAIYKKIAEDNNCHYISATELKVGEDGVHLTADSHLELAKKLSDTSKSILGHSQHTH